METIANRYGVERSIVRIDFNRIRVMGESQFSRISADKYSNKLTMFDFEGGPSYNIGGVISFEGLQWKIIEIDSVPTQHENFSECILRIEPIFPNEK
jgi:hypothetical protein